ncbi:MAG: NAD(P)(+) transhydrogenase (Re/Si-specific) subunit alpha, partial [Desertifilum sp. SIO1I2]|nr:NAD(P)(+) transhydrogenase (Re/Si-specific) subunit alpha [Desertifilum sp. SIO1I2]
STLLEYLIKEGELNLDFADDIASSTCITHGGEIRNARVQEALNQMAVNA